MVTAIYRSARDLYSCDYTWALNVFLIVIAILIVHAWI